MSQKWTKKMKITTNNFANTLNKISYLQLALLAVCGLFYLTLFKNYPVFTALLISGIASFSYTQSIKLSSYNKTFALYGFPIRLLLIAPPCAILVHKLHSNLIALFIGFVICQIIYLSFIWLYVKGKN